MPESNRQSRNGRWTRVGVVVGLAVLGAGGAGAQNCGSGQLAAALAAATSGKTVKLGSCTVTGPFVVKPGVILRGAGTSKSVILAPTVPTGGTAVQLQASSSSSFTTVQDLKVSTGGTAGVLVTGTGKARIKNLKVNVTRGVGIAGEGLNGEIEIVSTMVTGPVTAANAAGQPHMASGLLAATHGLVLKDAGLADIDKSSFDGFVIIGALFINTNVDWLFGGAKRSLEGNAVFHGGSVVLEDVAFEDVPAYPGHSTGLPGGVGAGFAAGVTAYTESISVSNNAGFGLFHDLTGDIEHEYLDAVTNSLAAVWGQGGTYLEVDDSNLNGNGLAGVVAIDTLFVLIDETEIKNTSLATLPSAILAAGGAALRQASPQIGDGVLLIGSPGSFEEVTLQGNARAGLLLDLSPSMTLGDFLFDAVVVSGPGQYGAIAQQGVAPLALVSGGITRSAILAASDAAFVGGSEALTVLGGLGPAAARSPGGGDRRSRRDLRLQPLPDGVTRWPASSLVSVA